MNLSSSEIATILHGLRMIQLNARIEGCAAGDCDHFEHVPALTDEQIDALCERINNPPATATIGQLTREQWRRVARVSDKAAGDIFHAPYGTMVDQDFSLISQLAWRNVRELTPAEDRDD